MFKSPPPHTLLRHGRSRSSRTPAHAPPKQAQTPGASLVRWHPHPKIKPLREVMARPPCPAPSLSAGVIDGDVRSQCTFPVACQPDACWQPPRPPPLDSSCVAARLQESRQHREGRCRKTAGGPRFLPTSSSVPPPTSALASLSLRANAEWWNESEKLVNFSALFLHLEPQMRETLKTLIKKFNSALIQEEGGASQPTNVEMCLSSKKSTFNFYTGQKKKKS